MKKPVVLAIVLGVAGLAAAGPAMRHFNGRNGPKFQTAGISQGRITTVVRAVGTVEPVLTVQVGSFVSGPIAELYVDFNDSVKKDDLMARIDTRIYAADVARDRAALATANAEVLRVTAMTQQARNDEARGIALQKDNKNFISDTELDKLKFGRQALEAQLAVAEANVEQADAKLKTALANLSYADIRSPVDGVVIERRVDAGQTVAATFTTPILFVVVPDLAGEMHVFAKVDEADIGLGREAKQADRPVRFTVDAYPDEFTGRIKQIRSSSTVIERVVTFPVVVTTTNPDRKLLPGMTANLRFETAVKENVRRVPNAAISFYPPEEYVRGDDRKLLAPPSDLWGKASESASTEPEEPHSRRRHQRHVWVADGRFVRAVPVTVGISDDSYTEIVSGDLTGDEQVVIDIDK
jgi:HlyD family secretion protein